VENVIGVGSNCQNLLTTPLSGRLTQHILRASAPYAWRAFDGIGSCIRDLVLRILTSILRKKLSRQSNAAHD
ncbi:hypothetical protein AVEN_129162-1, partial [Araneus ventricosus]